MKQQKQAVCELSVAQSNIPLEDHAHSTNFNKF